MNRSVKFIFTLFVLLVAVGAGIYLGGHPTDLPAPIREALVDDDVALQAEVLDEIEDNFYKKVDSNKLEDVSIEGMVKSLDDRFSTYLDPLRSRLLAERSSGKYSGIGVTVSEDPRGLRIADVTADSPAETAGIKRDDTIVRVDGKSIRGEPTTLATSRVRGPAGTKVKLGVLHPGGEVDTYEVERAHIDRPLVAGRIVDFRGKKYGVVFLAEFDRGAADQLRDEVERLQRRGADGIVLDLRGNPGGLISEAVEVASLFIKEGTIVTTQGRAEPRHVYEATGDAPFPKTPMVALVDRNSASAAEIVAGALQDRGRAELVGEPTFGKGVFQRIISLSNGGTLDLTAGHYYTPKGRDLGGKGLAPGVKALDRRSTSANEAIDAALATLASERSSQ